MAHPSLAERATLAVLLLVGFYVLAFAIIAGLLYIPYAEVTYLHRIDARLTIFAVVGAGAILWGILPRIDKFLPPFLYSPGVMPSMFIKRSCSLAVPERPVSQATSVKLFPAVPNIDFACSTLMYCRNFFGLTPAQSVNNR